MCVFSCVYSAVINYPFEDFDTYCMRLIIKLLGSDTVNQDTADVLLTALGTLFVKDKNALLVAKTDHTEDVKAIAARHSKNPKANFVLNAVLKTGEDTN